MKKLIVAITISAAGLFACAQEGGEASAPATAPATIEAPAAPVGEAVSAATAENAGGEKTPQTAGKNADAKKAPAQSGGGFGMFMPMLIILAIFYFMMIRPQQRKEKERRKMIDELKAGTKVIFAGGIIGKIVEANEKTFRVETAQGTEMEVLRSSVQGTAE